LKVLNNLNIDSSEKIHRKKVLYERDITKWIARKAACAKVYPKKIYFYIFNKYLIKICLLLRLLEPT